MFTTCLYNTEQYTSADDVSSSKRKAEWLMNAWFYFSDGCCVAIRKYNM